MISINDKSYVIGKVTNETKWPPLCVAVSSGYLLLFSSAFHSIPFHSIPFLSLAFLSFVFCVRVEQRFNRQPMKSAANLTHWGSLH